MKNTLKVSLIIAIFSIFNWACNKSSELGADLFVEDKFDYQYSDTLSLLAQCEKSPAIVGYVNGELSDNIMLVGKMEDPYFGIAEKKIYTQLSPVGLTYLENPIIDSVVFRLFYSSTGTYGDTNQLQKIGVYRLTEELKTTTAINNDKVFAAESKPLGTATFLPRPNVVTTVPLSTDTSTKINLKSRVSVRLDTAFGSLFFKDISFINDLTKFPSWFKGIEIRAETKTNTTTAFSFAATDSTGIYIYYRTAQTETQSKIVSLVPSNIGVRYTYSQHEFEGSVVQSSLNNTKMSDSTLFVQSNAGVVTKLEIPYIKNLGNIIVNKALLQFTVKPEVSPNGFAPVDRILLHRPNFETIIDATAQTYYLELFDGNLTTKDGLQYYRMNVTSYLHRLINGKESSYIYLVPQNQQLKASRSIFYGTKHPKYAAKLLLYYTKLKN